MKKENIKEHYEEEIKMKIQNNNDSTKDDVEKELVIKELPLKIDKSGVKSANMVIPNENLSLYNLENSFLLNNSLHISNISNSLSNSTFLKQN